MKIALLCIGFDLADTYSYQIIRPFIDENRKTNGLQVSSGAVHLSTCLPVYVCTYLHARPLFLTNFIFLSLPIALMANSRFMASAREANSST